MAVFILDEQLAASELLAPLRKKLKVRRLPEMRPGEHIFDDRVPEILRTLKQRSFVTIDRDFWERHLCHPGYSILFFDLPDNRQGELPSLLFRSLQLAEFRSAAQRMGKVARVRKTGIVYWQFPAQSLQRVSWGPPRKRR